MNILIVGDSAREHALAKKLADSSRIDTVYLIPGNDGTEEIFENVDLNPDDSIQIAQFAQDNNINIAIIGSEKQLANGLSDVLSEHGILVFGPKKKAAELEEDRMRAKNFMGKNRIPTPDYKTYNNFDHLVDDLSEDSETFEFPLVVKTNGYSEESVYIAQDEEDLKAIAEVLLVDKELGRAGDNIILEDYIEGQPATVVSFIDEDSIIPVITSEDSVKEDKTGTTTEASVSPGEIFQGEDGERLLRRIFDTILIPTIEGLSDEQIDYNGALSVKLVVDEKGLPQVTDYVVSVDEPQAENLTNLLKSDLSELIKAAAQNHLDMAPIDLDHNLVSVSLVILDDHPEEGDKEIKGLDDVTETEVYFSNVKRKDGKFYASGEEVVTLTATAPTEEEAWNKIYADAEKLHFDGINYLK